MERQYIGARYVPKFADPIDWQEDVSYEALTVVTYMGASYTSKKAVPAGVKPTVKSYWAMSGNYNAQVEEYRQLVVAVKSEVDVLNKKTGRNIIFIGDSYGANPRVPNTWCGECAKAMGLSDDKWHNLCVSGASFTNPVNSYLHQLTYFTGDRSSVTDIVLMGGSNDLTTARTELHTAADALMKYARENYPLARFYVGFNSLTINGALDNDRYDTWVNYNMLGYAGYCVIPNMIALNHDYLKLEDGTGHPNQYANNIMGWGLASYLSGGDLVFDTPPTHEISFVPADGYGVTGVSASNYIDVSSATLRMDIVRIVITVNEVSEWAHDSNRIIGTLSSRYFRTGPRIPQKSVQLSYREDGVWKTSFGMLIFNADGTVSLHTFGIIRPSAVLISGSMEFPLIDC